MPDSLPRHLESELLAALRDRPVVLLQGARQTGKSTLVEKIAAGAHGAEVMTLDDAAVLAAATRDPQGFVRELPERVVIDEVQLVPELFRAIKMAVDRDRRPGRFLLTGSADAMMLPRLSDSLAGRMQVLTLRPFSAGEIDGVREGFVDALFAADLPRTRPPALRQHDLIQHILVGGYPEVVRSIPSGRRAAWFGSYLATILQRDIRQLAEIEGLTQLPHLLELLAAQTGSLVNIAAISRQVGMSQPTIKRYLVLLQATFLVELLPAWSGSTTKRLARSPKMFVADTGLLAHVMGLGAGESREPGPWLGALLEAFVAQELRKQASWSESKPEMYFYRSHAGREVDFVLKGPGGRLVGVEVKSAASVRADDLRGLEDFAEAAGRKFHRGVLLYGGDTSVAFGDRLHAVPIAAMWRW